MKIQGIIRKKKGFFCLETEQGDYHLRTFEFDKYEVYDSYSFVGKSASAEDCLEISVPRPVVT